MTTIFTYDVVDQEIDVVDQLLGVDTDAVVPYTSFPPSYQLLSMLLHHPQMLLGADTYCARLRTHHYTHTNH